MVLRAKRGISYMGDVVVDDVAFVDCAPPITSNLSCHNNEFICANSHCISKDNLCDFIDHCGDGSDENHYICSEKQIYHPLFCHLFPDVFFFFNCISVVSHRFCVWNNFTSDTHTVLNVFCLCNHVCFKGMDYPKIKILS